MRVCSTCNRLFGAMTQRCPEDGTEVSAVAELAVGTRVGAYKIVRPLGEGGMGMVYEALHEVLGRRAAMKFLRDEWVLKPEIVTRFLQEAQAVNRIDHDGIINVYDYGDGTDGAVYFVMEFLEGDVLNEFQYYNRPIALPLLFHIYRQIIGALSAAHDQGIVHRDLKPANVFLVRREGNPHFVKLLDFGVAKVVGQGARPGLTRQGSVLGTPEFMSPEQIAGRTADVRSDIYSLGAMLYDAVVGHVPFEAEGFGALAALVLTGKITPPSQAAPTASVPLALEGLIMKALAKEPEARFQTTHEMLLAFDSIREACGVGPLAESTTPKSVESSRQSPDSAASPLVSSSAKSKRMLLVAAGVVAAAVVAVVAVFASKTNNGTTSEPATSIDSSVDPSDSGIAGLWSAGNRDGARSLAKSELRALLSSPDPKVQNATAAALVMAANSSMLSILSGELDEGPQRKLNAARALARLGMPEAGPKLREALAESGEKLRVELAAALLELGDRDSVAILERGLDGEPRTQLIAAEALARADFGDKAAPVLTDIAKRTPPGRARWLRANVALARIDVEPSRALVHAELARSEPERSLAAAILLGETGDKKAITFLQRLAQKEGDERRARAALAVAVHGDTRALEYLSIGLSSAQAAERVACAGIAARLGRAVSDAHGVLLAQQATSDSDVQARAAALMALLAM